MGSLHLPIWDYRYLIVPFGLLTIAATWGAPRALSGDVAAVIASAFVATAPTLVQWDRLYRMYAPLVALSSASWWLLLAAQQAHGRRRTIFWALYGTTVIILPYIHYTGALMVLGQALYALTRKPIIRPAIVLSAAVCASSFLPSLFKRSGTLP